MTTTIEERGEIADDLTAALREQVQAVVRSGKSQAACAKESGIANSTFSAWLNGSYQGDVGKISFDVRNWLESRTAREQTRAVMPKAPDFIETESAKAFFNLFQHAQYAPDFVVLAGAPGVGKTTAIEAYLRRHPNVFRITGQPCMRTPRLMLDDLADAMDLSERFRSSQKVAATIIKRLIGTHGLIIVDEAQHLTSDTLDQLRSLHDLAKIGIAVVGNETVYSRIEGYGRRSDFAQLFSRVGMKITRSRALASDVNALIAGWGVTDSNALQVLRLIGRKPGALRNVTKVMRLANMLAGAEDGDVKQAHIVRAWEQISNTKIGPVIEG